MSRARNTSPAGRVRDCAQRCKSSLCSFEQASIIRHTRIDGRNVITLSLGHYTSELLKAFRPRHWRSRQNPNTTSIPAIPELLDDAWQHAADFFSDILVSRRRHKLPRNIRSVLSLNRKARTMLSIPLISSMALISHGTLPPVLQRLLWFTTRPALALLIVP